MYVCNLRSLSYSECFATYQLEVEMVDSYKNKGKFTCEQVLFYSLTGAIINKGRTLAIFFDRSFNIEYM